MCSWCLGRSERDADILQVELRISVMWLLGLKSRSYGRSSSAINSRFISLFSLQYIFVIGSHIPSWAHWYSYIGVFANLRDFPLSLCAWIDSRLYTHSTWNTLQNPALSRCEFWPSHSGIMLLCKHFTDWPSS